MVVKRFFSEFKDFIKEYKVIGLAVAFVMGFAVNDLIKSFVNNIFMPIINIFIPGGAWRTATLTIGPVVINWGVFLSALMNFIILALIIFIVVKKVFKEKVKKKQII